MYQGQDSAGQPLNIGLLMTYNEIDVIDEMMEANRHSVDAIFVLDGSTDGTDERLHTYPEVKAVFRDEDVAPNGRIRDHHRQVLLDAAHEMYGVGHWFTLMHGDEIFHDDPRRIAELAERQGARRVNWASMQFFLHESDERTLSPDLSVQARVRWYSPFWVEIRQFRSGPKTHYKQEHGAVIPHGVGWRPYTKMPILKHYPFRDPKQTQARLDAMRERGFSGTSVEVGSLDSQVYRTRYGDRYRIARRFEGDFGVCELDRQGGLIPMMWRWKRWVT